MRAGLDAGMNWIDTAEVYGKGVSERLVGRAVAGRRDQLLVATKLGAGAGGVGVPARQVRAGCEALPRTAGDRRDRPLPAALARRDGGADRGDVGRDGRARGRRHGAIHRASRTSTGTLIERCEAIRHVDSLQQEFSMLALDDRELIRWCGEQGIGVVTYGPLGFGLLTGDDLEGASSRRWPIGAGSSMDRSATRTSITTSPIVDGLRPIAERLDDQRWPSSPWRGTWLSPVSRRRSPAAAIRTTRATTPRPVTSSWTKRTLAEIERLLAS